MRLASYVISLCLHAAAFLLLWFWPASPPVNLDTPPVIISLVDAAPGGNRLPSPILGHVGKPSDGPVAPSAPAPKNEVAAPAVENIKEPPTLPALPQTPRPKTPEPVKEPPKPVKAPEDATPVADKKKDEPKKQNRPQEKKQDTPPKEKKAAEKKPEKKKETPKPAPDPVAAALQQARKASSRVDSGDRGNAAEQALGELRRNAGGHGGGGGGEGDGSGGGGLANVYLGEVMLAVRPNWAYASASRVNLVCVVRVAVDLQGNVMLAELERGSGNAQFDASAVNAVIRTGQAGLFPPPPGPEYLDLRLVFNMNELMGR
ncbi:MAG: TonB C-terminal domain-containing protein [Desulfovibrionaceae bacterium]|nr:TonB C-terminal domain-containing protein [Desulfovibrionaceae bacterium]